MTISTGALTVGASNDTNQSYFVASASGNTSPSGSTFYCVITHKQPVNNRLLNVTDNKGNTWTQIGSAINDSQNCTVLRYYCQNGVGGTGHVVTATNQVYNTGTCSATGTTTTLIDTTQSWVTNAYTNYTVIDVTAAQNEKISSNTATQLTVASAFTNAPAAGDSYIIGCFKGTIVFYEITGGLTSGILDQSGTTSGFLNSASAGSYPSITLGAEAANGAIIISTFELSAFAVITYTQPTGYTLAYSYGLGTSYPNSVLMASAYQVVSGAGTYNPVWSVGGGSQYMTSAVDSFLGAGISGVASAVNVVGIGSVPNDGTGDPARVAFGKVDDNFSVLASAIARRASTTGTFGVSSGAGATNQLVDSTQTWGTNQFAGQILELGGSAATYPTLTGVQRSIVSNTSTAITVSPAFAATVPASIPYKISPTTNGYTEGSATNVGGTSPSTIVDGFKAWTTNQFQGTYQVTLLGGPYAGQSSPIASNTATTLTLSYAFATAIAAGTPYIIGSAAVLASQYVTAGTTVTVTPGVTVLELNGPTSMTVTLPTAAYDQQILEISTTTAITSFAMTGGTVSGSPSSLSANTGISFRYRSATTTWYRRY